MDYNELLNRLYLNLLFFSGFIDFSGEKLWVYAVVVSLFTSKYYYLMGWIGFGHAPGYRIATATEWPHQCRIRKTNVNFIKGISQKEAKSSHIEEGNFVLRPHSKIRALSCCLTRCHYSQHACHSQSPNPSPRKES